MVCLYITALRKGIDMNEKNETSRPVSNQSLPISQQRHFQIGDRVRRPSWGTGVVEAIENDPDGAIIVVVRHPRNVWRCAPGELELLD